MSEKFNFSKIKDQKKFENLPEKERDEVIGEAQENAAEMQVKVESGKAKDYAEAEKLVESEKDKKKEIVLTLKQERILEEFIHYLSCGFIREINASSLPKEIIFKNEVQQAAKNGFEVALINGDIDDAVKIKKIASLSDEYTQCSIKKYIINHLSSSYINRLSDGLIDSVNGLRNKFYLSEEFIRQVVGQSFVNRLVNNDIKNAIFIKEKFNFLISKEVVEQNVKKVLINYLSDGDTERALNIKGIFNLSEEIIRSTEVQLAAKEGVIKLSADTTYGKIGNIFEIKIDFKLSKEITQSTEIQSIMKKIALRCLVSQWIDTAIQIKNEFSVTISPQEIISQIPKLQNLLSEIQIISPEFYNQALKSVDIVISLIEFKDKPEEFLQEIKENPFLLDAVSENPRFASKLLIKYPQFDELSKENIQFLFEVKKKILGNNPEIEPESLEFRQLMQEKLKEYGNNQEILEAIEKSGINIEEWLNYGETKYFNLESGESHLAFSETISAPISRIKETIDSYAHTLKNVLREYKTELSEFEIPLEDTKEIEENIAQMQNELEKAGVEGNEKKAQGIEKGIESLKKKIENIKTVGLWDKLLGDISAFQQLKNDVFLAQENLVKAESDLQEKISGKMPSGRMIQDLKEKISKVKEELRSKFGVLETRIENFKTALPELLAPCLGKERDEALIQEIEQNLAEQFDHYNTDRNTLSNLFSERGDEKRDKLESQPMSIFVWARNPDIDLYQGNYTNCCIRIDSEHMGAESTIADYNTDLGVQIVNIWDETKNEPAVAAWCWLGKNENDEAVLVMDNIESNTLYSTNYPEQLTKELFDYLKEYAESIGAKKIVMGKANNDLPTAGELAKFKDDTQKYEKIGGSNRSDGYFLEAENKSVKIVWEAKEKEESKKAEKKGKEVVKIQFENLNISNLSEDDFAKIKQLERKIYQGTDLILGQAMIEDIKQGNGFEYSIIVDGQKSAGVNKEAIGYLAAVEDETEEGDPCVYLEDIAVVPEAQGQEIGWKMFQDLIGKLKEKARKENKPVLLDMHLREGSQRFMEKYGQQLEQMGVKLLEEAFIPDYYDEGEDALYKVYEIKN